MTRGNVLVCAVLAACAASAAEPICLGPAKARQSVTNRRFAGVPVDAFRGEVRTTTFEHPWQLVAEADDGLAVEAVVTVDVAHVDQEIMGFGTAVSELSWKSLSLLSEGERGKILDEMFSPSGGNFTVVRTPIGASDFALDYYSYDDYPDDFGMEKFSIERDERSLLPLLREIVKRVPSDTLRTWASPWCPPKWMKRTGCYASCKPWKSGAPNDCTPDARVYEGEDGFCCDDAHFRAYALYFRKYVDAYRAAGVPIWMVMPQNEFNSAQPYPSCTWTSRSMATFIGKYLGPALEGSGTDLFFGTVERASMEIVNNVLKDADCMRYVKGAGFQWGGKDAIVAVRRRYPGLFLVQTEQECGDGRNDWKHARHCWDLMRHYLGHGASVYEYWNMSLCDDSLSRWGWRQNSLVTVAADGRSWRFNIEYYVLKHVSHYVGRGSRRVASDGYEDALAFVTSDGAVVVVLGSQSDREKVVEIRVGGRVARVNLLPNSLTTFCCPRFEIR